MEYLFYPFLKFQCQNSVHTVYVKFDHHTKVGRICIDILVTMFFPSPIELLYSVGDQKKGVFQF